MIAKKFLGWIIVGTILLAVSALFLAGALINSKTVSPRKAEPMKKSTYPKRTYHVGEIFIERDIYININGKRTYVGMIAVSPKNIKVTNSGEVYSLSVTLNDQMSIAVRSRATATVPNRFDGNIDVVVYYYDRIKRKLLKSDEGYYINVRTGETTVVSVK